MNHHIASLPPLGKRRGEARGRTSKDNTRVPGPLASFRSSYAVETRGLLNNGQTLKGNAVRSPSKQFLARQLTLKPYAADIRDEQEGYNKVLFEKCTHKC